MQIDRKDLDKILNKARQNQPGADPASERLSAKRLYKAGLERRGREKTLENGVAAQARVLHEWLGSDHPTVTCGSALTIENNIRAAFREMKANADSVTHQSDETSATNPGA